MAELTEAARTFLNELRFGVAATVAADGSPQLTTMWYALEGDTLMMNTAVGRAKERNLTRDRRCSLCVEDDYRYVTVSGTAELDYDHDRSQADIAHLATRYHGAERARTMVANGFSKEQRVSIRFRIDRVISRGF